MMTDFFRRVYEHACYHVLLIAFALGIWSVNLACLLLRLILPLAKARAAGRGIVHRLVRLYIGALKVAGLISNNRILAEVRERKGGCLLVANHPSILDAPLFLAEIPGLVCVFKSSLKQGLLLSRTAGTLGYLSNEDGLQLLRELTRSLKAGETVLLFPEGTRTDNPPVNPFNKGYALAALRAGVPVQMVAIQPDSDVLSKRRHWLNPPRYPATFRFSMGPLVEPGTFQTVKQMNRFVEGWFQSVLADGAAIARPTLPPCQGKTETAESLCARFTVPADPFYCRGHMPGNPIVPGYIQMAWVRELAAAHNQVFKHPIHFRRFKFLQPLVPGDSVEIRIEGGAAGRVTLLREGEPVSRGHITTGTAEAAS